MATQVIRRLVHDEGLSPQQIVLVINGEGGLDDADLEASVTVLRMSENLGPAGGFRVGMLHAFETTDSDWFYLCEDDVGLFSLPARKVNDLVAEIERYEHDAGGASIGAVVAYGRDLSRWTGLTVPHANTMPEGFDEVDVAAWGSTLLSRRVIAAGVLPDAAWFFGYEDFDFWLTVGKAGFRILLDNRAYAVLQSQVTPQGRDAVFAGQRPSDRDEGWRAYYGARNFTELARRHGHVGWHIQHLVKSARRLQLAGSSYERVAILRGLADGYKGKMGKNDAFLRVEAETPSRAGGASGS